jgi:phytoene dehydrogenase-like protein
MAKAKKVLVIGTGPGGAGIATLLQKKGLAVTVLERNPFVGGKCWTFKKEGFLVDSGVHMFSMGDSGQHGDINRKVDGGLEWCVANPSETCLIGGMAHLQLYQSLTDPRFALSNARSGIVQIINRKKILEQARGGKELKALEKECYRASKRYGPFEVIKIAAGLARRNESLLAELDEITLQEFLHRITDDWMVLQGMGALSMLLTVTPWTEVSAGEYLWCFLQAFHKKTLGVPRGGSGEITSSFIRAFERNGGELRVNCEVARIVVEGERVKGVETRDGEFIEADTVISNAGIGRTVDLAGEGSFPEEYVKYVRGLKQSCSFITVKYGLERRVIDLPTPSFFNIPNQDPDHMFDYIFDGTVPQDPFLFTPMPSEWDSFAAPVGKQLVMMGVPGPIDVNPETVEHCERILDRGEERLFEIFPQIKENTQWSMRTHIAHTAKITGKSTGECIGLGQHVGQTGVHRPTNRTPVNGLWLVGADAGARGVGTEMASGSALYLANLID